MTFTVPTELCQAQFAWTGVQAVFPCGFPALSAANLTVQYTSNAGPPAAFNASISGQVLNVGAVTAGALGIGSIISGPGVAPGTSIIGFGSGNGGVGSYVLNNSQNIAAENMNANTPVTLALGVHYTVTLDPLTGNVTINPIAMPDNGPGTVTVTRNTPATQGLQLTTLETYSPDAITNAFDALAMTAAELKRRIGVLEAAAFGPNFAPSPNVAYGSRPQRSITVAGNLPITIGDSVLNINAATDLTPVVPAASTRNGAPITFKNLTTSHQQTLERTGADTFDGATIINLIPGAAVTLIPYNDGVNSGYAIE